MLPDDLTTVPTVAPTSQRSLCGGLFPSPAQIMHPCSWPIESEMHQQHQHSALNATRSFGLPARESMATHTQTHTLQLLDGYTSLRRTARVAGSSRKTAGPAAARAAWAWGARPKMSDRLLCVSPEPSSLLR